MFNNMNTVSLRGIVVSGPKLGIENRSCDEFACVIVKLFRRLRNEHDEVKKYDCLVPIWFFGYKKDQVIKRVKQGDEIEVVGFLASLKWTDNAGGDRNSLGIVGHSVTWYSADNEEDSCDI